MTKINCKCGSEMILVHEDIRCSASWCRNCGELYINNSGMETWRAHANTQNMAIIQIADRLVKIRGKINDKYGNFDADVLMEIAQQLRTL